MGKDRGKEEEQRLVRIIRQMNNVWAPEVKKDNHLPRKEIELQQIKKLIGNEWEAAKWIALKRRDRQTQELWIDKDGHLLHARLHGEEERR